MEDVWLDIGLIGKYGRLVGEECGLIDLEAGQISEDVDLFLDDVRDDMGL